MADYDDVARIARTLPEAEEVDRRGERTWVVRGRTFAWERGFSKADLRRFGDDPVPGGPILGIRVADLGEKEAVLGAGTAGVFTIPHFDGYAAVLVQLDVISAADLTDALTDGWFAMAPPALTRELPRP
jgi:hypothetical protein